MAETDSQEIITDTTSENAGTDGVDQNDGGEDQDTDNTGDDQDGSTDTDDAGKDDDPINPDDFEIEARDFGDDSDDSDDSDDDIDPEDRARINKVVDKRMSKAEKMIQNQNDEIAVNTFIINNPEMAKYKPVIKKYMTHKAYRNIPVKHIASIVSAKDMKKIGAKMERQAQKKVNQTKNPGNGSRKTAPPKFDAASASFGEMELEIAKVKGQV